MPLRNALPLLWWPRRQTTSSCPSRAQPHHNAHTPLLILHHTKLEIPCLFQSVLSNELRRADLWGLLRLLHFSPAGPGIHGHGDSLCWSFSVEGFGWLELEYWYCHEWACYERMPPVAYSHSQQTLHSEWIPTYSIYIYIICIPSKNNMEPWKMDT